MPPQFFYPPDLELRAIVTRFARPLGELASPPSASSPPADPPLAVWRAVTDLLHRFGRRRSHPRRPGGERVGRAARAGRLRSVDPAVDAAVATALRCGLPIAVVDRERLRGPLRVDVTARDARLAVDARGDTRAVGDLPALFDADGPRATPVAVAIDVAPTPATRTTLALLWGTAALGLADAAADLTARLTALDGACEPLALPGPADDPEARARLARVLADLDDDAARLAFAAWLDDHGGAPARRRARHIREALAGGPDHRLARAVAVDAGLADGWLTWRRGFVAGVGLGARFNPPLLPTLAHEPLEEVDLDHVDPVTPLPATVRVLKLRGHEWRPVAHRDPSRLRALHVGGDPDDDAWRWLVELPALERLYMHISDDVAWRPPTSPALRLLRLMGGRLTAATLAALPTANLVDLELHSHPIDDATLRALPPTPALETLRLSKLPITTLAPFAAAPLRYLSLWHVPLTAAEVPRILAMTSLETLHISDCPAIADPIARAIDTRGALPALRGLYGLYARNRDLEHGGRER